MIHKVLIIAAIVCFGLKVVGIGEKLDLTNLGLALLAASFMV